MTKGKKTKRDWRNCYKHTKKFDGQYTAHQGFDIVKTIVTKDMSHRRGKPGATLAST